MPTFEQLAKFPLERVEALHNGALLDHAGDLGEARSLCTSSSAWRLASACPIVVPPAPAACQHFAPCVFAHTLYDQHCYGAYVLRSRGLFLGNTLWQHTCLTHARPTARSSAPAVSPRLCPRPATMAHTCPANGQPAPSDPDSFGGWPQTPAQMLGIDMPSALDGWDDGWGAL